ncbi:hypothetical protein [Enterobacter hormaechei]|uniref:hypothetical protein n=1 Tax=Enterobacter hormaechei TaxID=158836 RepID=UPI003D6E6DD9
MKLFEMEGFLRGKCIPRDLKVNETNAEYLVRKFAEADAMCAALAAELQSVKAMNDCLSEELRGYESDGAFEGPKMHLLWWQCETPNHDAFLAELRAQGVDVAIEHLINKFEGTGRIGVPVMAMEWLAQELRKGGAA